MTRSDHAVHHEVDLSLRLHHLLRVTTTVPADLAPGATIGIATWTPGSYVERDYVHHLQSLAATDADGEAVPLTVDGRTAWRLPDQVAGPVTLTLEWYANDLTVRTNAVDDDHALIVPPATFPLVAGAEDRPVTVAITPTAGHRPWGLLPRHGDDRAAPVARPTPPSTERDDPVDGGHDRTGAGSGRDGAGSGRDGAGSGDGDGRVVFVADDQLHLVDSAFEVGDHRSVTFDVDGVPHRWVHANRGGPIDLDRVVDDVSAVARATAEVFDGPLPIEDYTFLVVGADRATGGGGLEHRDGAVLMLPVLTDATDDGVARTRSLVAHEYLHLWNVKRLVPADLVDLRLDRPTHTTLLWVAEGWTAYYDGLLPTRAGLASGQAWLDDLRDDLRWVQRTPGARRQSLVDSSWHAWTGLYVRDENSVNSGTSYYTHGAVVAAVLDLAIRREAPDGDGLDEAFRLLWERFGHHRSRGYPSRGYTTDDVVAAVSDAAGTDLSWVVRDHVEGTAPPPLADLLDVVGCELVRTTPDEPRVDLGIELDEDDRGPRVASVLRDGPAWRGGVSGGDRIVAIDGTVLRRGDIRQLLTALAPGDAVTITVERAHRLLDRTVVPDPPHDEVRIAVVADPTERQAATFARWTGAAPATVGAGPDDRDAAGEGA